MPFPIRSLQVDGGSEFYVAFETAYQRQGIRLFVLPPRAPSSMAPSSGPTAPTPKNSTKSPTAPGRSPPSTPELRRWEHTYNTILPHQALGYRTPLQFLEEHAMVSTSPSPSHM